MTNAIKHKQTIVTNAIKHKQTIVTNAIKHKQTIVTNAIKHKQTIVRYCLLVFRGTGEYISLELFYLQSKLSSACQFS